MVAAQTCLYVGAGTQDVGRIGQQDRCRLISCIQEEDRIGHELVKIQLIPLVFGVH